MAYCKVYPHHVKEIMDSGYGNFKTVPLVGAVGDSQILPALSTFLPVIVILYTPWTRNDVPPVYLSFCYGEILSIRCIIGISGKVDLAAQQICCTNHNIGQNPMVLKEPTNTPSLSTWLSRGPMRGNRRVQVPTSRVSILRSILSSSGTFSLCSMSAPTLSAPLATAASIPPPTQCLILWLQWPENFRP